VVTFVANCGQTAADSNMVKVPQSTLFAFLDIFSVQHTV